MSILGNAIMAGGGGSATRLICGAPGETITYAGAAAGTITLDSSGNAFAKLPNGTYQFTGNVSGYTKSGVVVDRQTAEIDVWPGTALFWYGRQNVTFNTSGQMATGYPEYTDDRIKLQRTMPQYAGSFLYAPAMDLTDYTSLHAVGRRTTSILAGGPMVSTHSEFNYNTSSRVIANRDYSTTKSEITVDISGVSGTNYVGIGAYTYNSVNTLTDYTYAIWLE